MEEQQQAPVEQSENASGDSEVKKDSVSLDSHRKLLSEKKNLQAKYQELENQLASIRQQKDLAEGNKDKVIEELRKSNDSLKSEFEKTKQTYAWNVLTSEIKREAVRNGCKDPDKLLRLMSDDDLKALEVGDNFSIEHNSLKEVIEKNKKENHFLFESSPKAVAAGQPSTKSPVAPDKKISELSLEELKTLYKSTYK